MNELTEIRSTDVIATEINTIKHQTQNILLKASIEIGKRLTEAKEKVDHGEWENWLKENVDYSKRTAQNLMKIHEEYGEKEAQALADLNYTKAVALLGIEAEKRDEFLEENDIEKMSTRELEKLIKENKKLEEKIGETEADFEEKQKSFEADIEKLETKIKEMENDEDTEKNREEIEKLTKELSVAIEKADNLQKELDKKPHDVEEITEIVEVVPDEIKKELERLREKTKDTRDEEEIKFKVLFDSLVQQFNETIEAADNFDQEEKKEKYKSAISRLIDKMGELV